MTQLKSKTLKSSLKRKMNSGEYLAGRQQYEVNEKYIRNLSELELKQVLEETDLPELLLAANSLKSISLQMGIDNKETLEKFFQIQFDKLEEIKINKWQETDWSIFNFLPSVKSFRTGVDYSGEIKVDTEYLEKLTLTLVHPHRALDISTSTSLKLFSLCMDSRSGSAFFPQLITLPESLQSMFFHSGFPGPLRLAFMKFSGEMLSLKNAIFDCEIDSEGKIPKFLNLKAIEIGVRYLYLLPDLAPNLEKITILNNYQDKRFEPINYLPYVKEIYGTPNYWDTLTKMCPNTEIIATSSIGPGELEYVLKEYKNLNRISISAAHQLVNELEGLQKKFPKVEITAEITKHLDNYLVEFSEFKNGKWKTGIYSNR